MEAYVIHPADYVPGKKYPAVFEIHGGPKGVSGTVFFHEFQCLASAGYFVFYGNPRGSDGRGEAYADLTEKFGADDFQDLMELSDQILKHYPDIDEKRVGICGGSYGGWKAIRTGSRRQSPKDPFPIICPNAYIQTLAIMPTVCRWGRIRGKILRRSGVCPR